MKKILLLIILSFSCLAYSQETKKLKIVSYNFWSGLDYNGTFKMGEYEPDNIREKRFELLKQELKKLDADIIFLQEINPAGSVSCELADYLGYDEIHQVCNSGLKIGPVGIPVNLNEGNIILARKELQLEEFNTIKLSGSFGLHGDIFSLHFDEAIFAVAGKINVSGTDFIVVNTHLYSASTEEGISRRTEDIKELIEYLNEIKSDYPVIAGGDFNAVPESDEIKLFSSEGKFIDCMTSSLSGASFTWDPAVNTNTKYSTDPEKNDPSALKEILYDRLPRRIDYIFADSRISPDAEINSMIVFNEAVDGIFISDHSGVFSEIDISSLLKKVQPEKQSIEVLPIVSYDTDVGFGYGAKGFFLNQLGAKESFDVILFNSTKGERWYRFVFSVPDFELRQRTVYSGFDLEIDYDKLLKNTFFGTGSSSSYDDLEHYTFEPLQIKFQFSRGFTPHFVWQTGLKFRYTRNFNFEENSRLQSTGGYNITANRNYSIFTNLRYDTRNSFINPSRGFVLQGEFEYAPDIKINSFGFRRGEFTAQYFYKLFYPKTIFASRLLFSSADGEYLPVQNLSSTGGNNTLRGYMVNRFMDKISAVVNAELRFPIYWRFGGIAGIDLGNVWHSADKISLKDWKINPAAGLRFYFDTFIVRVDMGFGPETTGFYLNFGHIF